MVDPRMAQATAVQMKIAMIAATRLNMVVVSRLSPPQSQSTSSSWHCQVLFMAKFIEQQVRRWESKVGTMITKLGVKAMINDTFLEEDNVKTEGDAVTKSFAGALQHNPTYREGVSEGRRKEFRTEWAKLIREESHCYVQP